MLIHFAMVTNERVDTIQIESKNYGIFFSFQL